MNSERVIDRIKKILVKQLRIEREPQNIADDEKLFKGGLNLDSVDSLEIIIAVEREFGVSFSDKELKDSGEIFRSIKTLSDFVETKLKSSK